MDPQTLCPSLTSPGSFVVGCNYWASHAGTRMWSDWRPEVVEADLRQLARAGLQVLRVFPLWPDFQPLTLLRTGGGRSYEYRLGEVPLPSDEAGQAGVSPTALQYFSDCADLAEKHGLKLIVGLITGWMSGRLFVPPAFEGVNVLTDPAAIQWQVRFVRYFVKRFKGHPAILAWDLGNECNVMGPVPSRQAAWLWTNAITSAIRLEDGSRPVVSGMHSLLPGRDEAWTMQDQGELTDLLTTHPYPYFTPHANADPVNTIRTILHSTSESRFYADIGGKPCLVEEIGTLGPMFAGEGVAADFARAVLFSLWAHDCQGLLWWCAYDQLSLKQAPYDWDSCERELGLVRGDRSEKPVLEAIGRFRDFLKGLPIEALPPPRREAVCILTEGQDTWGVAYSTFILAKQAGFDLEFQYADQPLKPASLYLAPCVRGTRAFSRGAWLELLQRVENGATLYLSHDDCLLSPINGPFGIELQTRERCDRPVDWLLNEIEPGLKLQVHPPFRLKIETRGASSLGLEADGRPALTCAPYGQGQIYFLTAPIEMELTRTPGAFHGPEAQPFWKIYRHFARPFLGCRAITKGDASMVGVTEHELEAGRRVVVLVNYSPEQQQAHLALSEGWEVEETWYGRKPEAGTPSLEVDLPPNDALVFTISRTHLSKLQITSLTGRAPVEVAEQPTVPQTVSSPAIQAGELEPVPLGKRIRSNYHLVELIEMGVLSVILDGLFLLVSLLALLSGSRTDSDVGSLLLGIVMIAFAVPLGLLAIWGIYLLYIRLARLGGVFVDVGLWVVCSLATGTFTFWAWTVLDINRLILAKLFYRGEAPVEYAWSAGSKRVRKEWERARRAQIILQPAMGAGL